MRHLKNRERDVLENTYLKLSAEVQTKRIIVFGQGQYFRGFMLSYPSLKEKVDYIMDNYKKTDQCVYNGVTIPVISPKDSTQIDFEQYIVVFCAAKWKEMQRQLDGMLKQEYVSFHYPLEIDYRKNSELGIYHRIIVPSIEKLREYGMTDAAADYLSVDGEKDIIDRLKERKLYAIPRLTVVLTPKCSLKCKECNNLMWKFDDAEDLSAEKIIDSLENIIEQVDFISCVELIGGEPFIARNIDKVLDFLLGQEKVFIIEITTNATIVPAKEILDRLKNHKIFVHISDYGNVVRQNRFIACMKENQIQFTLSESQDGWVATGGIKRRGRNIEDLMRQYYRCSSGYLCKTLWEDRIYPCARAASLAILGIMSNCPYVECSKSEGLREKIYTFYVVPSCEACDYCNVAVENPVYVEPAVQIGNKEG